MQYYSKWCGLWLEWRPTKARPCPKYLHPKDLKATDITPKANKKLWWYYSSMCFVRFDIKRTKGSCKRLEDAKLQGVSSETGPGRHVRLYKLLSLQGCSDVATVQCWHGVPRSLTTHRLQRIRLLFSCYLPLCVCFSRNN